MRRKSSLKKESSLPKARRRAFFLFTLLFPVVMLVLAEVILRAMDYGPDLSLFRYQEVAGRIYYNMNPAVKSRYFSRVQFNPMTSLDFFPINKERGTYRIFCLGGSTTAGYPYGYVGSFSTFLKQRLSSLFPEKKLEVINLGLTATNSFTTLDFARDLTDHEADLVIVYDGHNEFYGALGAGSNESVGSARWVTLTYLYLVRFNVFVFLRDAYTGLLQLISGDENPAATGTMMERLARGQTVRYNNDLYQTVLRTYRQNMSDLIDLFSDQGIPVILSSQVSNLRHLKPFVSLQSDSLDADKSRFFLERFRSGLEYLEAGQADSAIRYLSHAALIDSMRADLQYYVGRAYDLAGRKRQALKVYLRARDLDALRFRQSSDFNRMVKQVAEEEGAIFVDIEEYFSRASPDSIIGRELILEHLHPTAFGYFLMARAYAEVMKEGSLFAAPEEWSAARPADETALWENRTMTELDERAGARRTHLLVSGWPFHDNPEPVPPADPDDRLAVIIDQLLEGTLAWEHAHVAAAEHYEEQGKPGLAEREYSALITTTPFNVSPYLRLALLHLKQLKYGQAESLLLASLDVEPTVYACKALGAIAVDTGRPTEAIPFLRRGVFMSTSADEKANVTYLLALAYGKANMRDDAVRELRAVLEIDPAFSPARTLLDKLMKEPG